MANGGDGPIMKFLLGRILPRERRIPVDLPRVDSAEATIAGFDAILEGEGSWCCAVGSPHCTNTEIGRCFLRLANLDSGAFDRLSRYETALWRQVGQIYFLDSTR
jgi:hypothetical protein